MKTLSLINMSVLLSVSIQFIGKANELRALIRSSSSMKNNKNGKIKITRQELPIIARQTLDDDTFRNWLIINVYKTKNGEYEVELEKEDIKQVVNFYKNGMIKEQ